MKDLVCKHCGSTDVVVDAFARWHPKLDMFVLDEVFEYAFCNVCEGETTLIDKEYE